jgi:hypothetical protein
MRMHAFDSMCFTSLGALLSTPCLVSSYVVMFATFLYMKEDVNKLEEKWSRVCINMLVAVAAILLNCQALKCDFFSGFLI